jgi:arylsulfatase A-like enzyme
MKYKLILNLFGISLLLGSCESTTPVNNTNEKKPNIIVIYLDDLGYGDVGAYGAKAIDTPNMDMLANSGIKFTNGYATSATCTPSRYGLLTGIYPWRNKNAKILPGSAPLLIDTAQITIPRMLKTVGYKTAIVGKWHLGLGSGETDWNQKIDVGTNELGFDYSYILAATQDRVPTVYIKNGVVENLDPNDPIQVSYEKNFEGEPTGLDNPELLKMKWHHGHNNSIVNGIPRIGFMKGGEKAKWIDEDMADNFLEKAQAYIKENKENPFFLYYALQQPHVPRTPNPRFVGATKLGPRGDAIAEADWCIGQLIETLKEEGLLENTLIVLSSDNGPVLNDGYFDNADTKNGDHKPAGGLRGGKYSLYDAGTHVPFITYWKGKIEPKVSDLLVCQLDFLNSFAAMVGSDIKSKDGQDMSKVLLGTATKGRDNLILEATSRTSFREGDWVMIPSYKGPALNKEVNIELGNLADFGLFNLKNDPSQKNNLASTETKKLAEMKATFMKLRGEDFEKTEKLELK